MNIKSKEESIEVDSNSVKISKPSDLSDTELLPLLASIKEHLGLNLEKKPKNIAQIDSMIGLELHKFLRDKGYTDSSIIEKDIKFWKELNSNKCDGEFKRITDWRHGPENPNKDNVMSNWGKGKKFRINQTFFARNWKQIDLAYDSDASNPYEYASIQGSSELWRTVILNNKRFHNHKSMIKALIDVVERPREGDAIIKTGKDKEMRKVLKRYNEWVRNGNSIDGKDYDYCYTLLQQLRNDKITNNGAITEKNEVSNTNTKWKNKSAKELQKYSLDDAIDEFFGEKEFVIRATELIKKDKNVIIAGPPGTGKSWISERIAFAAMERKLKENVEKIVFHADCSYGEFVIGERPNAKGEFDWVEGTLLKMINKCIEQPNLPFFLIIDEINRANLTAVFGETWTLLEPSTRGKNNEIKLMNGNLFHIPENLHIIGTMNKVDRITTKPLEFAVMQRFSFLETTPLFTEKWINYHCEKFKMDNRTLRQIKICMDKLNENIISELGTDYQIGHRCLTLSNENVYTNDTLEWYKTIVKSKIIPILKSYPLRDVNIEDWQKLLNFGEKYGEH